MNPLILIAIFIVAAFIGYKLIGNVPKLLHTPLMSGMNAISGITLLGALTATAVAVGAGNRILGGAAIILAMINITAGFGVTNRMLRMFRKKEDKS